MAKVNVKKRNQAIVLSLVRENCPISRQELIKKTSMPIPTLDRHLYALIDKGIVQKKLKDNRIVYVTKQNMNTWSKSRALAIDDVADSYDNQIKRTKYLISSGIINRGINANMSYSELRALVSFMSILAGARKTDKNIKVMIKINGVTKQDADNKINDIKKEKARWLRTFASN